MMRKIVGWIVVIGMFLAPTLVLAEANKEFFAASTEKNTISEADLKLLFGQNAVNEHGNSIQLALLTDTELKETEGAWLNFAIGGGIGLGIYAYNNWRNMTWGEALRSTALGALSGYSVGVAGLRVLGPYCHTGGIGVALGRPGILKPGNWYGNARQFGRIDFHREAGKSFIHTHRGGWRR